MLHERIKTRRKLLGFTQKELGDKIGASEFTVSKYERAVNEPDIYTLYLLSDVLECSVDYLVGKVDDPTAYHHVYNDAEVGKVEIDYPYQLKPEEVKEMVETLKRYHFDVDALIKDMREKEEKEKS